MIEISLNESVKFEALAYTAKLAARIERPMAAQITVGCGLRGRKTSQYERNGSPSIKIGKWKNFETKYA